MNIAEILKDKSSSKLYSPICGECYVTAVSSCFINVHTEYDQHYKFTSEGYFVLNNKNSKECLLFPSKEMRDWEKLTWKRGDVLYRSDTLEAIIFIKWEEEDYSSFKGRYLMDVKDRKLIDNNVYLNNEARFFISLPSNLFKAGTIDDKVRYIQALELITHKKFNLETLELESVSTFKPFDKVVVRDKGKVWEAGIYSHYNGGKSPYVCGRYWYDECLPYNEKTAKLIGTRDDYKEG